ncbi:hypothetical protein C1646_768847 [Rhizophagus diaphanus]|nr:hypothetical protein C1646_768847 [Rhizophagus diaphanus] [Rhizophagus sp. MUCL 43196]
MTSNTNNISDQVNEQLCDDLYEELLYEVLLYKKKDIIAIQEKLDMVMVLKGPLSINDNTNQTALNQSKKGKSLEDSFGLSYGSNIWGITTWRNISFNFIFGTENKLNSRSS